MAAKTRRQSTRRSLRQIRQQSEDYSEPLTEPVEKPLAGVVAYVDVRSGTNSSINTSSTVSERLTSLGATIASRLTKDVSHLVFKDGKTNLDRLQGRDLFIVNPLWVDGCAKINDRISEAKFPVIPPTQDDSTPVILGRIKRMRSMQPKPFEDSIARSLEKNRKKSKIERREEKQSSSKNGNSEYHFTLSDSDDDVMEIPSSRDSTPDDLPPAIFKSAQKQKSKTPEPQPQSSEPEPKPTKRPSKEPPRTSKKPAAILPQYARNRCLIDSEDSDEEDNDKEDVDPIQLPSRTYQYHPITRNTKKATKKPVTPREKPVKTHSRDSKENDKPLSPGPPDSKPIKVKVEGDKGQSSKSVGGRKKKGRGSFEKQRPTLVVTSVSPETQGMVYSIVNKLGVYDVAHTVTDTTTHIVCGANRRTFNILAGTAKGCWILSLEWVWKSLESGGWISEEGYEMIQEFPAAQYFRLERQHAGLLYRPSLFHPAGSIYVSGDTRPPPHQLELLLSFTGAKLTGSRLKADVCICGSSDDATNRGDAVLVTEAWVIESITERCMLPMQDFQLGNSRRKVSGSPEL